MLYGIFRPAPGNFLFFSFFARNKIPALGGRFRKKNLFAKIKIMNKQNGETFAQNRKNNKMKRTILAFTLLISVIFPSYAAADDNTLSAKLPGAAAAEKSSIPSFAPSVRKQQPLLSDLKVGIEFLGGVAFVSYDMVFYNPAKTVTGGELVIPLKKNQNVSSVAFEINGKMREAVAVEKGKAVRIFKPAPKTDSAEVPPEKVSQKRFKTGTYSFAPESYGRIKITVEETMPLKDGGYVYDIDLSCAQKVNFDLNIEIPSSMIEGFPQVKTVFPDLEFKKGNNVLKASFSQKDYSPGAPLSLFLPKKRDDPVFTHKNGKETYFYADLTVKPSSKNKNFPKKAAVIWDMSLSAGKRNIEKELALLDAYFKKIGDAEVEFAAFNIKMTPFKKYTVERGAWGELKKDILRIICDGATRFDKVNLKNLEADEILLFTDGISTLGNTRIDAGNIPAAVISSCAEFNYGALMGAALKSGGVFIDLNSVSEKKAARLLSKSQLKLVSYSFDKNKIKEIYPKAGTPVDGNFVFSGILASSESEITLSFGYDKNNIVFTKKIKLSAGGDNPAVERLWAARKIKELELDAEKNSAEILRLAKKYSLISAQTSLAVLESAADYAAFKVKPPPEFADECKRLEDLARSEEKRKREAAVEDAVLQAQDIKDWWKHDYKPESAAETLVNKETAFVVKPARIFAGTIPAASEGEVKEPSAGSKESESGGTVRRDGVFPVKTSFEQKEPFIKKESAEEFQNIKIKARDPQAPYMKIIKNSFDDEIYSDYLKLKAGYGDMPSFYFDIADEFIRRKMKDGAVTVLSNIAEIGVDSPELLRAAAYKLMEVKSYSYACDIFEKIVKIKPQDPQSYRDLALAYQADKKYKKALEAFYKILAGDWDRFQSIKQIAFVEMNNLISLHPGIALSGIDKRLVFAMPVDMRIVLSWSADETDIDIYVKEPSGAHASYANRFTDSGGRVSEDLTQGFGPEEYMIKKAPEGRYEIFTDFCGDDKNSISGPTVLYLDIYTFYATKKQTHKRIMIRTDNVRQKDIIGTADFKRPSK